MTAGAPTGQVASQRMLDGNDLLLQHFSIDSATSEVGAYERVEPSIERGRGTANQYGRTQRQDTTRYIR